MDSALRAMMKSSYLGIANPGKYFHEVPSNFRDARQSLMPAGANLLMSCMNSQAPREKSQAAPGDTARLCFFGIQKIFSGRTRKNAEEKIFQMSRAEQNQATVAE